MSLNFTPYETAAVVAVIDPQTTNTAKSSAGVDMENFEAVMAIVSIGAVTATGTVDAKLEQCTAADGTGAKALGTGVTQLTDADGNKQVVLETRREKLDYKNGFNFVRVTVTPATAASYISAVVLGFGPRYGWASANDMTTVDEVVTA